MYVYLLSTAHLGVHFKQFVPYIILKTELLKAIILTFDSVGLFLTVKMDLVSISFPPLFLVPVIGSSFFLSPLSISFMSRNKVANGAWK